MKFRFDDLNIYLLLLEICSNYNVDPSCSIECEDYFTRLLDENEFDSLEALEAWFDDKVKASFRSLKHRPHWVQGSNWPFYNGEPMLFVEQFSILPEDSPLAHETFHDETVFYVFMPNGHWSDDSLIVVTQQY